MICCLWTYWITKGYVTKYDVPYVHILDHYWVLTYSITPRSTALPEQLTGLHLVKKFPSFHGTRRFITALTSVRHLSLSWASPIQSIYPHPTSWRSILILSTHLRLGLPSGPHYWVRNQIRPAVSAHTGSLLATWPHQLSSKLNN